MGSYNENSIDLKEGAKRVRDRPAAILGSDGLKGAQHGVIELFGNASDEASAGYGNRIDFKRYKDGGISIRDYGRGVPLGWNEKRQSYNWHLIYNEMYGGGKYDDNQEKLASITDWSTFNEKDYNYLYSVGLNGLGASATQYCSEYFHVVSIRRDEKTGRNYKYWMDFEKGLPIIDGQPVDVFESRYDMSQYNQVIEETDEPTGTFIHWKPDSDVFSDVDIKAEWLKNLCMDIAYTANMEINFEDEESGESVHLDGGTLRDLLIAINSGKLHTDEEGNTFVLEMSDFSHGITNKSGKSTIWVAKSEIAMSIAKNTKSTGSACFHNLVRMQEGIQYSAVEDAVSDFLVKHARSKGVSLQYQDYAGVFAFVVSSFSNIASFRGQTKDGVDDAFIYTFIKDTVSTRLELEYGKGNKEIISAIERVIDRANMRIQLKEAEKQIRTVNSLVNKRKNPEKFATCKEYMNKDYHRTELWITEGDSAKGSVMQARDSKFQAVYPIRGKSLNILKSSIQKMLANKEVMDIISLLGTGIDLNIEGIDLFDINNLKFDKIIFATDADVDGYHIRILLFVLLYRLAPKLITEGHVFIAETPRYGVALRDGTTKYVLNEEERDEVLKEYAGQVVDIKRFKGLGEVDPPILRETTVGVEHRRLIPVTCDLDNDLECELIDALFGEDKHKQRKSILTTVLGQGVEDDFAEAVDMYNSIDEEDIDEDTEVRMWG